MIRIHREAYYLWWSHHNYLLTFTISVKILFWDLTQLPTDKTEVVGRETTWRIKYIQTLYEYFQIIETPPIRVYKVAQRRLYQVFNKTRLPREETLFLYHILWWMTWENRFQQYITQKHWSSNIRTWRNSWNETWYNHSL